uniref:Serine aminopeptidase S33 domain-containing protein n=1 Tax=Aegilops tauschii subsp. strangulata TaxID=200361 RepID=A0A453KRW0_AEGTS
MDWIGHGGSDGAHGYVSSLDHAVGDLKEFLEDVVLEENYGLPCFLFGHSTGGAIVLKAALDPCVEVHIEGLILTSPAIHVQPSHPIIKVSFNDAFISSGYCGFFLNQRLLWGGSVAGVCYMNNTHLSIFYILHSWNTILVCLMLLEWNEISRVIPIDIG